MTLKSKYQIRVVLPRTPLMGEEKALAAVAANRNNPKIKKRPNLLKTMDMPKVNRNKTGTSPSPASRPSPAQCLRFPADFSTSEEHI